MFEGSEGFKLENEITSDDQTNLGVYSEKRRAPPSLRTKQQIDTTGYVKLKERYFLICQSCFWCASYLESEITNTKCPLCDLESEITNTKCPLCDRGKIDCMSVGDDKSHPFNYRKLRSLTEIVQ